MHRTVLKVYIICPPDFVNPFFKDIYGIAKAKSEIIENIIPRGTIILNRDDKFFNYLSKKAKARGIKISTFGPHLKK